MYKDLLVYLNGSENDAGLIGFAEALAVRHEAFLTGLFCSAIPEVLVSGDAYMAGAGMVEDLRAQAKEEADEKETALRARFDGLEALSEFRRLDQFAGRMPASVTQEARVYDLTIATRTGDDHFQDQAVLDSLLFNSGRGCLFVPKNPKADVNFETVVVGWRNTPEATRAIAAAMPLLAQAKKVVVAMVIEKGAPEHNHEMPGADISRHLGRHGAQVELRQITGWSNPGAALLNEIEMNEAGLLVMGGFGHSRLRERILGGATHEVLGALDIPVLMAH